MSASRDQAERSAAIAAARNTDSAPAGDPPVIADDAGARRAAELQQLAAARARNEDKAAEYDSAGSPVEGTHVAPPSATTCASTLSEDVANAIHFLASPAPDVIFENASGGLTLKARVWVDTSEVPGTVSKDRVLSLLYDALRGEGIEAPAFTHDDVREALVAAKSEAHENDKIVVFGSFLTVAGAYG